jgi:hypothetical protein
MHLPEKSVEAKFRRIAELSELRFKRRDAYLKQSEDKFFVLFGRLKREALPKYDRATLEALRYAFRFTWAKNDFASLVQAGKNLPQEILQQEPLLAAYYAASQEQLEALTNPSVSLTD